MIEVMLGPTDPYPDVIARLIRARITGDENAASAALAEMPFIPAERRTERWPAMSTIVAIYARDRYQCRYCGQRVILTALLRLVARLYPRQFPYHRNWKADSTHPAFISRSATLDHIEPVARGGDPTDLNNLVTACWNCNRRKGDLDLHDLGWTLVRPRTHAGWDSPNSSNRCGTQLVARR
jgi:5-methylcytosine-specific restriction endonuclease McrA